MAKGQALIDITGNVYNHLTVLRFSHMGEPTYRGGIMIKGGQSYWEVECRCGKILVLRKSDFAYAHSKYKSCGCWGHEERSIRQTAMNKTPEKIASISGENHWIHKSDWRQKQDPTTGRFTK